MSIMTIETTITRKYLLGKSKSDLAYMYLELLERAVQAEADARALAVYAERLEGMCNRGDTVDFCNEHDAREGLAIRKLLNRIGGAK